MCYDVVNDKHATGLQVVALIQKPPCDQRHSHDLEEPGHDHMAIGIGILIGNWCTSLYLEPITLDRAPKRQISDCSYGLDAGKGAHATQQLRKQCGFLGIAITSVGKRDF